MWYEIEDNKTYFTAHSHEEAIESRKKWFPYNKGGEFRKWYGNNDYVVNWENDGYEIKHFVDRNGKQRSVIRNPNYMFKQCVSWSLITDTSSFRYKPNGYVFDVAGMSIFSDNNILYLLSLLNTKPVYEFLKILAPTKNAQCGDIARIPVIIDESKRPRIEELAKENIEISRADWDSFETSWDFKRHPLV